MGICDGRVVVITGAANGIGREHALAFAAAGASVVVNDVEAPDAVIQAITEAGGTAIPHTGDCSDEEGADSLVRAAIETFGGLDVVVNNAGIVRDRMFVSATVDEWDAVIRVHLRGHFLVANRAAAWWRAEAKAGRPRQARIVNTSSGAGLQGSIGQSAYAAAKGGIASLTLVQAAELARYGVTANAIAPAARTRMTETVFADMMKKPESGFDAMHPGNISPLVVWLGSTDSEGVTGRVFEVAGGKISIADGWRPGPEIDKGDRWDPAEVGAAVAELIDRATPPAPVYGA